METTDRSPEIHRIPDVATWLTYNDAEGQGVSHASAQCPEFAKDAAAGKTLVVEQTATGWLCGYCTDTTRTVIAPVAPGTASIDRPATSGTGTGSRPGSGASEKQVALIERLCAELGRPVPAIGSKAQASEFIDGLMEAQRDAERRDTTVLTEAEIEEFLAGLGRKVEPADVTPALRRAATVWAARWTGDFQFMVDMHAAAVKGLLSAGQAKGVLNCWRADLNRRPAAKPAAPSITAKVTEDGMYRNPETGEIAKVQVAHHGSGNLYAKRLVVDPNPYAGASFVYESGLINRLRPEWKMTLDEAKEFGKLYGICCQCAAILTDEKSIAAGIGPICAGKSHWA